MRGKKSAAVEDPASQLEMMLEHENAKRAAFVGMRGKKAHYEGEEPMAAPEERDLLEYILNRYMKISV